MDLSTFVIDTSYVLQAATIIVTALGSIWGVKKLIKLVNRS